MTSRSFSTSSRKEICGFALAASKIEKKMNRNFD
jgi:hypothetical protein